MELFSQAHTLYTKALSNAISSDDLDCVIRWPKESLSVLFSATDQVRTHFFCGTVEPCSLMNIKAGGCFEDCAFCAQSAHNHAEVTIKELASEDDIVKQCLQATQHGLSFCVVSSGRKLPTSEIEKVARALKRTGVPTHASLGILTDEEFKMLKDAGVVCYNHNIESSEAFYPRIVGTHVWADRIATVKRARAAGLSVCCGGIFGMGETWEDRKSMCLALREVDVHTIPLNFLNAIKGTRLSAPQEDPLDFLKIVALFRLAHPKAVIKVCGGRELNLKTLQPLIFYAGANGYVSGNYLTTSGAGVAEDDAMIAALGLTKDNSLSHR